RYEGVIAARLRRVKERGSRADAAGHELVVESSFRRRLMMRVLAGLSFVVAATAADLTPTVTFNKDVLPILQKNCQTCHRPGQVARMSLLSYKDARPWAKAIKTQVTMRTMPPWFADPKYGHFTNDRSLKQSEIDTLAKWADTGTAEGNPKDVPAPVQW